ncbi:nucleotidyltransferase domain-containing protein [Streptomyces sp. AC495_CC817]|uniref:nucleotidyltransferase domain-containing protein n=1 Tax=Streptomyces sp. AC495_CC817 TaxID=2823900 RepID=UPI001C269CC9|nr:nucleotidyltransferase domain-containing protein [Streptomyces sp. AC495_CC817]
MDHTAVAERFIAERFPRATIAVIAGSTARGDRTATSDIDLLLIGEGLFDGSAQSEASTHAFGGEIFEVFAYTPEGFREWAERGIQGHRPVIVHMLVDGIAIREDDRLDELRAHWSAVLAEGPRLSTAEALHRRYVITDVLDDYRDATDALELRVLSSVLFERTAELMLLTAGRWIGAGKWLPRRLRALSADRAEALSGPFIAGDHAAFAERVEDELRRAGGRVQAGHVR